MQGCSSASGAHNLIAEGAKTFFSDSLALVKGGLQSGVVLAMRVGFASVLVAVGLRPETVSTEPDSL